MNQIKIIKTLRGYRVEKRNARLNFNNGLELIDYLWSWL